MKKLFALAALVLGLASCQNEPEGLNVVTGGEVDTVVTVSLPEATRASSADSGLANVDAADFDLRYILEVYDFNITLEDKCIVREVVTKPTSETTVAFPVRLIAGRDYKFVVWADFVETGEDDDLYYNTEDGLDEVTVIDNNEVKWTAMTEARDAYTSFVDVQNYSGTQPINLTLTRPFGKLRVVTTDIDALNYIDALPTAVAFNYTLPVYVAFNALTGETVGEPATHSFSYNLADVQEYDEASASNKTLFTDYLFVGDEETLVTRFSMDVTHANTTNPTNYPFNTDIPVVRNQLTTIIGSILTDANNVKVEVKPVFVNEIVDNVVDTTEEFQAALDYATPGTTIYLQPGIKYGVVSIRPVAGAANTIEGCDYLVYKNEMLRKVENLTIVGAKGATVDAIKVVSGYVENSGSTGYVVDIKGLTIDSVEFNANLTPSGAHSIASPLFFDLSYINVDGLTVKNCKVVGDNNKFNFVYLYGSGNPSNSTFETAAKNVTITNNEVDGIARLCELRGTENVTITNNTIKNTYLHGILLPKDANGSYYSGNVTITGNYADGIKDRFVRMAGAGDATVVVKDNTIVNYLGAEDDYIKVTDGANNNANVTFENNILATAISTAEDLTNALAEGGNVVLTDDLTDVAPAGSTPYGNDIKCGATQNGGVIDGNGNTLDFNSPRGDNYGIMTSGGTIKNMSISGVFRAIMIMNPTENIYIDNVVIADEDDWGVCYAINTGEGDGTNDLYVSNCTLKGWTSIGNAVNYVEFTNCKFGQGLYYTNVYGRLVKPYVNAVFENCEFESLFYIDLSQLGKDGSGNVLDANAKITLKNCTVNGVKLTAENWTSLVADEDNCGEGQISIELKNGSYMTADNVADYVIFE
ncbi:MAG: right-handed parallel beta-helix repeat-containing protein [Alistipes sp.]|nr:right-handed parallel beta-helix repeat-containing protein [Alistipes sp.]